MEDLRKGFRRDNIAMPKKVRTLPIQESVL